MIIFAPWEGLQYKKEGVSGVRLLVLGEAHYGTAGDEHLSFTTEMVEKLGQRKHSKRSRFFTMVAKLVLGMKPGEWLSQARRKDFWDRVAFYNFIQSFPGKDPRISPSEAMWESAIEPFKTVVQSLAPEMILVCGKRLSSRLPILDDNASLCRINHPSSGIRYADWQPSILATLESVRRRKEEQSSEGADT